MKGQSIISNLHAKFAEKSWNETFQLVRRCMEKPRDKSKPCEPLVRTLQRLQEGLDVSSVNTMRSRLEMIAKQQGMGFHITDDTCYLTADLFYLEVVLLPCGGVEEVKVAPHGGSPAPSESLRQLLRLKNFAAFSMKLAGLFRQYNIPGDKYTSFALFLKKQTFFFSFYHLRPLVFCFYTNLLLPFCPSKVKLKLFTSLQSLWKDLQLMSLLPREPKDSHAQLDMINNGRIGCLMAGKQDCPPTIQFYINPADVKQTSDSPFAFKEMEAVVQTAQVTLGVSDVNHKLQMASVIPQPPQLDAQGNPVFLPLNEVPNETLPACFLLKLQPAVPVTVSFVKKLSEITDVTMLDVDLQWAPLPKLLMRGSLSANSHEETLHDGDPIFTVSLFGGVMHRYIFPGAAWDAPERKGTAMDSIPFTHPAHVPPILELLRQQCAFNILLSSCITPQLVSSAGLVCNLHFEVLLESDTSFSVTFQQPDTDNLAVCLDSSTRTLSTPSPGLILPSKSSSLSSPALSSNGHETNSSSSSSAPAETVAVVHPQPGTHTRSRQSKAHSHAPIDLLPDHTLLQIFSHLPTNQLCRCARVCRRWYNLAWDPRLWSTIRLTGELLHADRAIRVLTHRLCQDTPNVCLTLETVVVNGCKRLTDRGLHVVAQCCPELRRLEVAGCYNISNEAVFEVVSRCPNLEHLNLSGCSKVTCISLTQEASLQLSPLHGQQISIHYLDMTDCFSLEDEGLRTIAYHCPRLTHLYLRRCTRLTDEALRHLALHCPSIKELSLSDCRLVGDFGLREVARLEGCLRYLSVAHCTRITDVGMRYVARYCPRLRYLNARGCEGLTDHGLGHLARSCPKLKSLDVGKCPLVSDSGLEQLAMYCQGLRRVSLRACESVTGRGLKALAANCCELQLLNVQDCEVSPEALRFVRRHCRRCVIEHTNPAFY
ncbi:uncharacterized protein [Channa argus]|uniref:uncharacterized protein isoform X3 n=1 Tax=Channa argus TaxID=215402 RepID=UPI0035221F36